MILSKQKIKIQEYYAQMKSKEDLVSLLNYVNKILYGDNAKIINKKSLTFYSNPKLATDVYEEFKIPKKSGGFRVIHSPDSGLKSIQRALSLILQCIFDPHPKASGFVQDKSIVDNARPHINKKYVFNTDLKDFFPSIDKPRFWKRIQYPPFNLNEEFGRLELANRIAGICFTSLDVERKVNGQWKKTMKYVLPQGAPTSPVITNIIAYRLDRRLNELAEKYGCVYSRYADDITFSSQHNIYKKYGEFRIELNQIINEQNFHIKHDKTRLNRHTDRQEVTGLVVNKKVNVRRRYIKVLRHWIYFWERFGYDKADVLFKKSYFEDKGYVKNGDPKIENVIHGKLEYLKMVKGDNNSTYKKLKNRFDVLTGNATPVDINALLNLWENDGIEAAMEYYYSDNKVPDRSLSDSIEKLEQSNLIDLLGSGKLIDI